MWAKRSREGRLTRCLECSNPPCTSIGCPTCKVCRNVDCTAPKCTKPVQTLNSKVSPTIYDAVLRFNCERCQARILCSICNLKKPATAFGKSVKVNQSIKDGNMTCLDCANPPCTAKACTTCKVCRNVTCKDEKCTKPMETLHSNYLPSTHQDVLHVLCETCRFPLRCCICATTDPAAFGLSAKQNRAKTLQNVRCVDCSTPPCAAKNCRTCKLCCDPKCGTTAKKPCPKVIASLNSKQLPRTYEEVLQFLCSTCSDLKRFPPCSVCSRDMPKGKLRTNFANSGSATWTCGDCLTLQVGRQDRLKHTQPTYQEEISKCDKCDKELPRSAFSESRWRHRREQRVKCMICESTHPCDKCQRAVHKSDCTTEMWNKRHRQLFCTRC